MIKREIFDRISAILFVVIAIILIAAPYQGDSTLGSNSLRTLMRALIYFLSSINVLIVLYSIIKDKKTYSINIVAILPILILFIMTRFNTYNEMANSSSIIYLVLWSLYCLSSNEVKSDTYKIFKKIWVFICIAGIICYFSYKFNLFLPYNSVSYYVRTAFTSYIDYKFIYLYKYMDSIRLCGICNEPGYFGTFCALILCASRLNLRDRQNILIFIAGIFSFSFAFYLIIIFYLLLKSWKNIRSFIVVLLVFLFYIFALPNIHTNNEQINRFLERFIITESGLSGDNRSTDKLNLIYKYTISSKPFFGMGNGYVKSHYVGEALTYKTYLIEYGIFGCLLLWGSLFFNE